MKIIFLTEEKLENIINEISEKNGNPCKCKLGFSEELDADILTLNSKADDKVKVLKIQELFPHLNEYFNVNIENYDVCEFGDYGEGFAFFIQ